MKKIVFFALFMLAACAEKPNNDYPENVHKKALAEWMRMNRPALVESYDAEGGYYHEITAVGDMSQPTVAEVSGGYPVWVRYEWDVRTLQGNLISTRSETLARQIGDYAPTIRYIPLYQVDTLLKPLRKLPLRVGSEAVLYREGSTEIQPTIVRLKITEIVPDPVVAENWTLEALAAGPEWDDIQAVDTLPPLYIDRAFIPTDPKLVARFPQTPDGDTVGDKDLLYIWYTIRSLDGFVIETNILEKGGTYKSFVPSSNRDKELAFWYYAAMNARHGAWHALLTPSDFAYGASGTEQNDTHSEVQGYEPLRVEFYIEPKPEIES